MEHSLASTDQSSAVTVLVVDDEPLIRLYATDVLSDAGYVVIEAQDADEALKCLGEHPEITVLFTDINMPGPFDGLELARRVHDARPGIQLILTSGRGSPSKAEIPDDGSFVPKPYRGASVAQLIKAVQGS